MSRGTDTPRQCAKKATATTSSSSLSLLILFSFPAQMDYFIAVTPGIALSALSRDLAGKRRHTCHRSKNPLCQPFRKR